MLTQKQVALLLGISTRTVRRLTRGRVLRAVWYEGCRALRYPREDVEAYLIKINCGQERTGADRRGLTMR